MGNPNVIQFLDELCVLKIPEYESTYVDRFGMTGNQWHYAGYFISRVRDIRDTARSLTLNQIRRLPFLEVRKKRQERSTRYPAPARIRLMETRIYITDAQAFKAWITRTACEAAKNEIEVYELAKQVLANT